MQLMLTWKINFQNINSQYKFSDSKRCYKPPCHKCIISSLPLCGYFFVSIGVYLLMCHFLEGYYKNVSMYKCQKKYLKKFLFYYFLSSLFISRFSQLDIFFIQILIGYIYSCPCVFPPLFKWFFIRVFWVTIDCNRQ